MAWGGCPRQLHVVYKDAQKNLSLMTILDCQTLGLFNEAFCGPPWQIWQSKAGPPVSAALQDTTGALTDGMMQLEQ